MALDIITDLTLLRRKSDIVTESDDVQHIIAELEDAFKDMNGFGLSAPQIGIFKQVAIIRMPDCTANIINPVILEKTDKFIYRKESCFSLPGLSVDTDRYRNIVVETGMPGNRMRVSLDNLEAVVWSHEIDHLFGMTILDRKHRRQK